MGRAGLILAIAVARAAFGTVIWDSIIRLTSNPSHQHLGYSGQRSLAVDRSGNIWVFWLDQRTIPYQLWYRRYEAASRIWLPEEQLTYQPVNCYPAAAAADCQDNIHLVWHMEAWPCRGIWYKRYDAGRRIWLPETLFHPLAAERNGRYPVIAALPGTARVAAVWAGLTDTSTTGQIILRELVPDSGWTEPFSVTTASCDHQHPSLAFDSTGGLFVVWQGKDQGNPSNQIFCRRRIRGEWQPFELVSAMPAAPDQYNPAVSVSPDGNYCHIFWHGRRQTETYLRPLYRQRTPSGWLNIEAPGGSVNFQREQLDGADLKNGKAAAVWRSQLTSPPPTSELLYCERDSTGYWSAPEIVAAIDTGTICEPTILINSGDIHIVWYNASAGNSEIYYRHGTIPNAVAERATRTGSLPAGQTGLFDSAGRRAPALPRRPGVYFLRQGGAGTRKLVVRR